MKKIWIAGLLLANLALVHPAQAFLFGPSQAEKPKSEMHYAKTPDGWKLALEHVAPAYSGHRVPVILCHGLGYNGDFWMLSPEVNLPRHLANQGFDVWILSLRGSGKSTKWMYKLGEAAMDAPGIIEGVNNDDYVSVAAKGLGALFKLSQAKMDNASPNPKYMNWSFDDYADLDVPTAIDFVKGKTGSPEVFWVGHSMGGNVLLAHLATNKRDDLRGVVTVGSQLTMAEGHMVTQYINTLQWLRLIELKGGVDVDSARRTTQAQSRALLFNQRNMESDIVHRLETSGTDTPAVGVLGQYMELMGSTELKSADNRYNYARNAGNIDVPLLITAGAEDSFVSYNDLLFLNDRISSGDKQVLVWGPTVGMYPFGHNDALISRRAAMQVYPVITDWLKQHLTGQAPPPGQPRAGTVYTPTEKNQSKPMKAVPALEY